MYQALYRKYRPRTFSDVTGQEHVTVTLRRQIIRGRQSHAYLFVGTRGTGKTTCAKVLSRAINCENPVNGDPCNKCKACVGIENGSILDVLELDAASNTGVDDVRALRDEAIYSPAVVNKRVYIIDEAHMLSNSAFNALLKILEEPPEHLVFILATTAVYKIPSTILSRCQRFSFKRISLAEITARLHFVAKNEGFDLSDDAAKMLAALADGSMRDALSLLDQCASDITVDMQRVQDTLGLVGRQEILNMVKSIAARDMPTALGILDKAYNDGRDMTSLLSEIASLIRDVLVYALSPGSPLQSGGFTQDELSALSSALSPERLLLCLDTIREAVFSLSRNASTKLTVEMSFIRMCDERLTDDVPALLTRIERLEREFDNRNSKLGISDDTAAVPHDDSTTVSLIGTSDNADITTARPAQNSEINRDKGFWHSILELLRSDMSIYSLLSDSSRVQAELRDNNLVIRAGDSFTVSLIESKKFSDPLTDAARNILGGNTAILVEVGGGIADDNRLKKIDDLNKFGIVRFE